MLRGASFIDLTLDTPQQFFSAERSKDKVGNEMKEYLVWVKEHCEVDRGEKALTLKETSAEAGSSSCSTRPK